jgi:succinyl-diaminopimelate desuccinylase
MITEFLKELINIPSITPDDGGCIDLICKRLEPLGFISTHLQYEDVKNIWITHGDTAPVLCFLGHTDVVPTGPIEEWDTDPFKAEIKDGFIYGRGAADMKGSIAAMVNAFERYTKQNPQHPGTLAMLLTSDEEGQAVNGTRRVIDHLLNSGIHINWCVVGEPTSQSCVGDVVKIGRRGSLTGHLTVSGIQGHIAYPDQTVNPIHQVSPALTELCNIVWDKGNEHYDPTSFQISNINAGTGADNVIPGKVQIQFNIRYSTEVSEETLIQTIRATLKNHGLQYEITWLPSSKPFLTESGELLSVAKDVIKKISGQIPELSTSGGTSDGRFIAPTGAQVIELGPLNETIHKVNECVKLDDLNTLADMYLGIIDSLLVKSS